MPCSEENLQQISESNELNGGCLTFLIIGSGIAGLTAASELVTKYGVSRDDILVIESRDRIGGRVLTGETKLCGGRLDSGAAWLHGEVDNPLVELLNERQKLRVSNSNDSPISMESSLVHVSSTNPWMHSESVPVQYLLGSKDSNNNGSSFAGVMSNDRFRYLLNEWLQLAPKICRSDDDNETIINRFLEAINYKNDKNDDDNNNNINNNMSRVDLEALTTFLTMIEVWSGGSVKRLPASFLAVDDVKEYSTSLFGDYKGSHWLFEHGAESIIEALLVKSGLGVLQGGQVVPRPDKVLLEQQVVDITFHPSNSGGQMASEWDDNRDGMVHVRTASGRVFTARHVIVTAPPGPLQRIRFDPPLQGDRTAALARSSMGAYKKIQMEWPEDEVFWTGGDNPPLLMLRNHDVDPMEYFTSAPPATPVSKGGSSSPLSTRDLGPFVLFDNYVRLRGMPILEAICPGDLGWVLAGVPDDVIVDVIMTLVRQHFPDAPDPSAVLITRWEEDVHCSGAYSYHPRDVLDDDCRVYSAPLGHRVFFAGEHTDPVYYGSLNAAHNSGVRVAKEVFQASEKHGMKSRSDVKLNHTKKDMSMILDVNSIRLQSML